MIKIQICFPLRLVIGSAFKKLFLWRWQRFKGVFKVLIKSFWSDWLDTAFLKFFTNIYKVRIFSRWCIWLVWSETFDHKRDTKIINKRSILNRFKISKVAHYQKQNSRLFFMFQKLTLPIQTIYLRNEVSSLFPLNSLFWVVEDYWQLSEKKRRLDIYKNFGGISMNALMKKWPPDYFLERQAALLLNIKFWIKALLMW